MKIHTEKTATQALVQKTDPKTLFKVRTAIHSMYAEQHTISVTALNQRLHGILEISD